MISHHHKCVFVHIPKNAGQSVEMVFLKLLHLDWSLRAPLLLRKNDIPELGPPRLAHLTAEEYVKYKYIPQEMFDTYFKFAFVRNPWDRMVSLYNFLGYDRRYEFKHFLKYKFLQKTWRENYWFVRPQSDFICSDSGELLVDFLGRFENLQEDFYKVVNILNLPTRELPHVNRTPTQRNRPGIRPKRILENMLFRLRESQIPKHASYRDYYDDETRELLGEIYQRDIEIFNYSFDSQRS